MGRYDDDDDDIEVTPRATRRRDDEEDETPKRRTRAAEVDEDEDEAPASKRPVIRRGWGAAEAIKNIDSPFAQRLKLDEEPVLVKFLEDDPYASYRQHWMEGRTGQKSFTCIAEIDDRGCPLCESGNRPSTRFAFNVVLLTNGEDPTLKSYEIGPRAIDQLKNFHTDPRQGPLTKHYWAISRTGKGSKSATNHQMVKERDLVDEWDVDPLTESDIRSFVKQAYGPDIIPIPKWTELRDIAAEDE